MNPDAERLKASLATLDARPEERRLQDRSHQSTGYELNYSGWYARMIAAERENVSLATVDLRQLTGRESENPEPPTQVHIGAATWRMRCYVEPPRDFALTPDAPQLNDSEPAVVTHGSDSRSVGIMCATGPTHSGQLLELYTRALEQ